MPDRVERKYFCVPFSFLGNPLRPPMSQVLHVVFSASYVVSLFVSLHVKHLEDEMDLPLETLCFSIAYKGHSLVCVNH